MNRYTRQMILPEMGSKDRAADRLRPHWAGEIVLLADPPPVSTGGNP